MANVPTRPLCIDYSVPTRPSATRPKVARSSAIRPGTGSGRAMAVGTSRNGMPPPGASRPKPRRGPAIAGATRLSPPPPPRFAHWKKVSLAVFFATGGILVTTASTGTVDRPEIVGTIDLHVPDFFFDDSEDALGNGPGPGFTATSADAPAGPARGTHLPASGVAPTLLPVAADLAAKPGVATPRVAGIDRSDDAIRPSAALPAGARTTKITVESGDTLSAILANHGVGSSAMRTLLDEDVVVRYLTQLRIGQELELVQLADGRFHSLAARLGNERRVTIQRDADGFAVAAVDLPVEKERVVSSGTIEQSLYLAAEKANLKQSTIMSLADIFQWELDFARDIRAGDRFSVVYDRLYREGRYIGDGDILAAEFVRGGKAYSAFRFTTDDGVSGYYSADGRSKRRTFLRHPVDVVRITSRFDPNRMHPVLHTLRAHRGVDYGSPYGSPIFATADGTVSFAGVKGAYGNMVQIRHGQSVDTLYAHMSKISDKATPGSKVHQGDVIGYVGRTGRVTGTHLHYEFRKNGTHVDPLTVEFPAAAPLPTRYLTDLRAISESMEAQMRSVLPAPGTSPAPVPVPVTLPVPVTTTPLSVAAAPR